MLVCNGADHQNCQQTS